MAAEEKERTIFVGNGALEATKKNIKKLFAPFGSIESIRLRSLIAKNAKLSKKVASRKGELSANQQSLHFYVKFLAKNDADKALTLNGTSFMDHILRVDRCSGRRNYDGQTTVFVGGCPFAMQDDELRTHFEQKTGAGSVDFVRVVRDPSTGKGRGIAFVAFKEIPAAVLALQLDGTTLNKREIRVSKILKKKKRQIGFNASNNKKKQQPAMKKNFPMVGKKRKGKLPPADGDTAKPMPKALRKAIRKKQKAKSHSTSLMK